MPNERLTTDYVEGWEKGAEEMQGRIVRDLATAYWQVVEDWPWEEQKGVLGGVLGGLLGLVREAPVGRVTRDG